MSIHFSDLQAVATQEQPKYCFSGSRDPLTDLPQPLSCSDKVATTSHTLEGHNPIQQREQEPSPKQEHSHERHKRLCGLTERSFWFVLIIVAVIVIAATVGGGVGASLNKHRKNVIESTRSPAASMSSSTTTATPPSSVTISTTTIIGSSQTLLSDCPSSNNTVYSAPSTSQLFRKVCGGSFLRTRGTDDCINQQASSLDACIGLCAAYNVQYSAEIASSAKSVCNSVCWRATIVDDDHPGQCYGFTAFNSSGTFVCGYDSRCNSAALINQ